MEASPPIRPLDVALHFAHRDGGHLPPQGGKERKKQLTLPPLRGKVASEASRMGGAFEHYRIVGMMKLESPWLPSSSVSGQRAVTVFTLVQNFTPSMPCWLVSPKAERFQPPKV